MTCQKIKRTTMIFKACENIAVLKHMFNTTYGIFETERLVVGCGFCTFGDPLNLQLVRIVQSRTHSKPFMSHSHASASCTPLSSVHFTAPSEKNSRKPKKNNKDLATSPEIRVVLETLFFLFFCFFLFFLFSRVLEP